MAVFESKIASHRNIPLQMRADMRKDNTVLLKATRY